MQKLFNNLYQGLMGLFYGGKTLSLGTYKTEIFGSVGIATVGCAAVLMLVFYYLFNKAFRSGMSRPGHWILMLLAAAGIGAGIAIRISLQEAATQDTYLKFFILVNSLVGALWFVLFSVLFKRWSDYARTTPFTGPF